MKLSKDHHLARESFNLTFGERSLLQTDTTGKS
jgi:hypothetical protein